jgi:DNA modification methylase
MIELEKIVNGFSTAEARWARFGPYYAMFPLEFAFDVVTKYSKRGDYILDPFAGRGSSIYAGGVLGRYSWGIEINPVGWLFGKVKIQPGNKEEVINRLFEIYEKRNDFSCEIQQLPEYFRICFCDEVLKFLLAVRTILDWKRNDIDATLISFILIYLHGKVGAGLSNQMRMTKSMGMNYSIMWWKRNNMTIPPQINPYEFLLSKISWRYEKGTPNISESNIIFGDSVNELIEISEKINLNRKKFSLLFTSPPYYDITNYHADQWLRLWLLGGATYPESLKDKHKGRFGIKQEYYELLDRVFGLCSQIMKKKSTIYVRTDKREFTFNSTLEILTKYFPKHTLQIIQKPLKDDTRTQTKLFGDKSMKPGEVDLVLTKH